MTRTLTYPNVVATLALVIALATGIYALASEGDDSPQAGAPATAEGPAPDSLGAEEIRESDLATVPRARRADAARRAESARRAGDAARLGGRPPSAFAPSSSIPSRGPLVRMRIGDQKRLVRARPFALTANCVDEPGGLTGVQIAIEASVRGAQVAAAGKTVPLDKGDRRIFLQIRSRRTWVGSVPWSAAEPGGRTLAGLVSFGVGRLGADCAASMTAIG